MQFLKSAAGVRVLFALQAIAVALLLVASWRVTLDSSSTGGGVQLSTVHALLRKKTRSLEKGAAGEALDWADDWMRQLVARMPASGFIRLRDVHAQISTRALESEVCVGVACRLPLVALRNSAAVVASRFAPEGTKRLIPRVMFRALWPNVLARDAPRNSKVTQGFLNTLAANSDLDHILWTLSDMSRFMAREDIPGVLSPSVRRAWLALRKPIAARCDLFRAAL